MNRVPYFGGRSAYSTRSLPNPTPASLHASLALSIATRSSNAPFPLHRPPRLVRKPRRHTTLNICSADGFNPHREQQTIPQGQTSSPPKSFFTPTAQSAPRLGGARDVGRGAGSHTPSTASEFVHDGLTRSPALQPQASGDHSPLHTHTHTRTCAHTHMHTHTHT